MKLKQTLHIPLLSVGVLLAGCLGSTSVFAQQDHDHSKCNHTHLPPSDLAVEIERVRGIIPGKWLHISKAGSATYHFHADGSLNLSSANGVGQWQLMGQDEQVIARLWVPAADGALQPSLYGVVAADKKALMLIKAVGVADTLYLKSKGGKMKN